MFDPNSATNPLVVLFVAVATLLFGVAPLCALLYFIYFVLTLPMRRRERARLFLYLLEIGLNEGRSPENAIADAAVSDDYCLGKRFYELAAHVKRGLSLGAALDSVPFMLSARACAILKAGERIGDLRKVMPACNNLLRDGVSTVRGAIHYLVLMAFVITPMTVAIPVILRIKVFPSYREIFADMYSGYKLPALTRFMLDSNALMTALQVGILVALWIALVFYCGGPRLRDGLSTLLGATGWTSPWSWKRMQRDFSAMLAVLLDSGLREVDAVRLAADATASPIMEHRAREVCARLAAGTPLPEALNIMDRKGELTWRIKNVLAQRKGFLKALTGWHESLDARAFQLEQAGAQITTSALVLVNGAIVALIVIGVFVALIQLLNDATLW